MLLQLSLEETHRSVHCYVCGQSRGLPCLIDPMEFHIKSLIDGIFSIEFYEIAHELLAHAVEQIHGHNVDHFSLPTHQNNAGVNDAVRVAKEGRFGHFDWSLENLRDCKSVLDVNLICMNDVRVVLIQLRSAGGLIYELSRASLPPLCSKWYC